MKLFFTTFLALTCGLFASPAFAGGGGGAGKWAMDNCPYTFSYDKHGNINYSNGLIVRTFDSPDSVGKFDNPKCTTVYNNFVAKQREALSTDSDKQKKFDDLVANANTKRTASADSSASGAPASPAPAAATKDISGTTVQPAVTPAAPAADASKPSSAGKRTNEAKNGSISGGVADKSSSKDGAADASKKLVKRGGPVICNPTVYGLQSDGKTPYCVAQSGDASAACEALAEAHDPESFSSAVELLEKDKDSLAEMKKISETVCGPSGENYRKSMKLSAKGRTDLSKTCGVYITRVNEILKALDDSDSKKSSPASGNGGKQ